MQDFQTSLTKHRIPPPSRRFVTHETSQYFGGQQHEKGRDDSGGTQMNEGGEARSPSKTKRVGEDVTNQRKCEYNICAGTQLEDNQRYGTDVTSAGFLVPAKTGKVAEFAESGRKNTHGDHQGGGVARAGGGADQAEERGRLVERAKQSFAQRLDYFQNGGRGGDSFQCHVTPLPPLSRPSKSPRPSPQSTPHASPRPSLHTQSLRDSIYATEDGELVKVTGDHRASEGVYVSSWSPIMYVATAGGAANSVTRANIPVVTLTPRRKAVWTSTLIATCDSREKVNKVNIGMLL